MKKDLLSFTLPELEAVVTALGHKSFRAGQIFSWLYKGKKYAEMVNVPSALRNQLENEYVDQPVTILETYRSDLDDTRKFLYRLSDGNCIEGVLMRYHYGYTLCVSTQAGCNMGCAFCASTLEGKVRNLTAGEILGQVICANSISEDIRIHNIVLMGSGEPLDNYDKVIRFLRLVSDEKGLNIGLRHISLSTCGLVDRIYDLIKEELPVTLSVSLHAPDDQIRTRIMPIAKRYSIDELIRACRKYVACTGRRVVFEYALIRNVNSSPECAKKLAALLRGFQCHVNLIPLNTVKERNLIGVSENEVRDFLHVLDNEHISATRRREMGDDIDGACGQLRRRRMLEAEK